MLTILDNTIRILDGLYSLNDLHKASGGKRKHRPTEFFRSETGTAIIGELEREFKLSKIPTPYKKVIIGKGKEQGTYVCRELVYSYAMWISPRFQLLVIRAFDALATRQQSLTNQLNQLCQQYNHVNISLSNAGWFLCVAGKQIKPKLQQAIDGTLKQMQPCLSFGAEFEPLGGVND